MRSGYHEAMGFFEQALGIVDATPESRDTLSRALALRTGLGQALTVVKGAHMSEVQAFYTRSLELCDGFGDAPDRFQILFGLWYCHLFRTDLVRASQAASELLATASGKDAYQQLEAHHAMWTTKIHTGRPAEAIQHLERAEELHRAADRSRWRIYANHDPWVCSHGMGAIARWSLGYFDHARRSATQAVELAGQLSHPFTRVVAAMEATLVFYQCGEVDTARGHAETQLSIATEHVLSPWRERAAVTLARLMVDEGRTEEALRLLEANLPVAAAARGMMSGSMSLGLGAETYARAGHPEKGLGLLGAFQPEQLLGLFGPELHRLYAELLLACSPTATDEAEARLRTAIALAQERQMKALELRAALSLARLLANRDRGAAREALAVVDWFTEGADTADLRTARALREQLN